MLRSLYRSNNHSIEYSSCERISKRNNRSIQVTITVVKCRTGDETTTLGARVCSLTTPDVALSHAISLLYIPNNPRARSRGNSFYCASFFPWTWICRGNLSSDWRILFSRRRNENSTRREHDCNQFADLNFYPHSMFIYYC